MTTLEERSRLRRQRIVAHSARSHEDAEAWDRRIEGTYGRARANWIDLDSLIAIKSSIDHPRHRENVRILRLVRDRHGDD